MMLPSVFGENLFDELLNEPFERNFFTRSNPLYGKRGQNIMKTDVKEKEDAYEVDVDLPGFKKEDVAVKLENGYLTISAAKQLSREEQPEKHNYIRKERYEGSCSRSFFIGDDIRKEDISAKLEDGILRLTFPKKGQKEIEQSKVIAIE
ncbi:MAG: Hsp20/alpha crystallin family protein [Pyramidobacter sp.]|nr:Hsp20/alpha crystallin family protein [Pyramidobacter sp.]